MRMTASWSRSHADLPNTRVWRDVPRPMASSPRIVRHRAAANTETRHWEKMQRASSGLTTNAPYKPAPAKAGVPQTIAFQTKPAIALEQIKAARAAGLPAGVVLMDAGYGNDTGLRTEITALGLRYVAGIGPNTSVWPPGAGPLPPPQRRRGGGRPAKLLRRDGEHQPLSAKACPGEGRGRSLSACRHKRGKPSFGAKAAQIGSHRASHGCGCGRGPSAHGLDGVDGPRTASMCQGWVVATPTEGSHP